MLQFLPRDKIEVLEGLRQISHLPKFEREGAVCEKIEAKNNKATKADEHKQTLSKSMRSMLNLRLALLSAP